MQKINVKYIANVSFTPHIFLTFYMQHMMHTRHICNTFAAYFASKSVSYFKANRR